MSNQTFLLIFACSATAHYVIAMVLALYARHQVKYLSLAWIMAIFAVTMTVLSPFVAHIPANPTILHPAAIVALAALCYLQSIFPLSIPMPGYLQWGRMWKYATPAIVFIALFCLSRLWGYETVEVRDLDELWKNFSSVDLLVRIVGLLISVWYIVNIFRLPHKLTHVEFPRYLIGYSTMLGFSAVFYVVISIKYNPILMAIYIVIFTALNLYLCFRTLETMAITLPKPVISAVEKEPTEEELKKAEEDFNEANLQRFHRVEYWMQRHIEEWKDNTFGRDRLCEQTGINRHLLLQCVRSQGYNNVHDYINSYRIDELKRMIQRGMVSNLTECLDAGFGTIKTARACFLKKEAMTLDAFLTAALQKTKSK